MKKKKKKRVDGESSTADLDVDESSQQSDLHVSVMEVATGKQLKGEDAPLVTQINSWLEAHPGWEVIEESDDDDDEDEDDDMSGERGTSQMQFCYPLYVWNVSFNGTECELIHEFRENLS